MTITHRTDVDLAAKLFRGFGDSTRLAILQSLANGEKRVANIVSEVGTSQANISGHLACLKDCGLVEDRPEGRQVFYRIAVYEVFDLLEVSEQVLRRTGHKVKICPNNRKRSPA
jgi:DNA-binding transcriptional ArsR family regulator